MGAWPRNLYAGPGGGLYTGPGGGLYTGPGGGLYTGPGGGLYRGPGGGLYAGPGGGLYRGPNGGLCNYMTPNPFQWNWPPIHILVTELEKRGMHDYAELFRQYFSPAIFK